MAIPKEPPQADLWVRLLIPAAVAALFGAVLLAERTSAPFDLKLVAPRQAQAGATIPLRTFLLAIGDGAPTLVSADVEVELWGPDGTRALARSALRPSAILGSEGEIAIPEDAPPLVELRAVAQVGEEQVWVNRRVEIAAEPQLAGRRGRLQTDLQRYTLELVTGPAPPDQLDARVVGGDCSAPGDCRLMVWVGEPPAAISLANLQGASIVPRPGCDGTLVTTGVVECAVRTTNNEAKVDVVAVRDGAEVGRRPVRLPMGLATPKLTRSGPLGGDLHIDIARRHETEGSLVVDLFHEGRWHSTRTLPVGQHALTLGQAGLWRVQARADIFGVDHAATRLVMVADTRRGLDAIARHPRENEWRDPMAVAIRQGELRCWSGVQATGEPLDDSPACSVDRLAEFMLAAGELDVAQVPMATSGAAQVNAGLHDEDVTRRAGAAILIMLAGLMVAIVVVRRGQWATRQARQILQSASDEPLETSDKAPWEVYGSGAFIALAFLAAALLVLSRGCL